MVNTQEENTDYEDKNLSEYEKIIKRMRDESSKHLKAEIFVPSLYQALIKAGLSPKQAREKIKQDCYGIWALDTIDKYIPVEAKKLERSESGRKGKLKQLSSKGNQVTTQIEGRDNDDLARINQANYDSVGQNKQEYDFSEKPEPEHVSISLTKEDAIERVKNLKNVYNLEEVNIGKTETEPEPQQQQEEVIRWKAGEEAINVIYFMINKIKIPEAKKYDLIINIKTKEISLDKEGKEGK